MFYRKDFLTFGCLFLMKKDWIFGGRVVVQYCSRDSQAQLSRTRKDFNVLLYIADDLMKRFMQVLWKGNSA